MYAHMPSYMHPTYTLMHAHRHARPHTNTHPALQRVFVPLTASRMSIHMSMHWVQRVCESLAAPCELLPHLSNSSTVFYTAPYYHPHTIQHTTNNTIVRTLFRTLLSSARMRCCPRHGARIVLSYTWAAEIDSLEEKESATIPSCHN